MNGLTFGQKLQTLLEERDMSQKQLSEALSLHDSTVRNYVRDLREPDFTTLRLIAEFFEVSLDYLLSFSKPYRGISDEEMEFLRILRALTPEQRQVYFQQGRAFTSANAKKATSSITTSAKGKAAG